MKERRNFKKLVAVFNTDLSQYEAIQGMYETEIRGYFTELASDVRSPYYSNVKNYSVVSLGDISKDGEITLKTENLGLLADYQDEKRIEYQRIIQTLNFLPNGYFKMPTEMQKDVQEQIQQAVSDYVNKYADVDKLYKQFNKKDEIELPPVNNNVDVPAMMNSVDILKAGGKNE